MQRVKIKTTDYADPYEGLTTEPEDYINRRCQPIERSRVHEIMENELRCVQRASNYCCNRECEKCDLLMDTDEIINAYGYVILMLEKQKPDYDDVISREAVHKLRKYVWVGGTQTVSLDDIDELPPVTQKSETVTEFADRCRECGARYGKLLKQKTGHWILKQQGDRYADYYCSECENELNLAYCTIKDEQKKGRCLYCDHCGAEMESEE